MLFGFQNANRMFKDVAEGQKVKFRLLKIMFHGAKWQPLEWRCILLILPLCCVHEACK
jgi:hypothetical protein